MPKQNFLLVSLEESQSKQLAEVLSNDTSRKLIDYLSEHEDATETGLSKTLNIPLPTVHYNLQKLKEAQLVTVEEFHYSKKGREVDHYKLANKYIIITPKSTRGIKTALKSILPVTVIFAGITFIIAFVEKVFVSTKIGQSAPSLLETARVASESAPLAMDAARIESAMQVVEPLLPFWAWFLLGGIVMFILFIVLKMIRRST